MYLPFAQKKLEKEDQGLLDSLATHTPQLSAKCWAHTVDPKDPAMLKILRFHIAIYHNSGKILRRCIKTVRQGL